METTEETGATTTPTENTGGNAVAGDVLDNAPDFNPVLEVEKPEFQESEVQRATEHFQLIATLIERVNERLTPDARLQGCEKFTARAWLMRLDWTESTERPGFWDHPQDIWPADRHPDPAQLLGAARILWHWLEDAGYEPYLERSHAQPMVCEDPHHKPIDGDFRGYFFYLGINWTVTFCECQAPA